MMLVVWLAVGCASGEEAVESSDARARDLAVVDAALPDGVPDAIADLDSAMADAGDLGIDTGRQPPSQCVWDAKESHWDRCVWAP